METRRKNSKKRQAILDALCATKEHPTAEMLYHQLKPRFPELSLGTVYRNLALFQNKGLIRSVGVVLGLERFDGNTQPHVHFICTGCGEILDLTSLQVPVELASQVARETGAHVNQAILSFHGLCGSCKQNLLQEVTV